MNGERILRDGIFAGFGVFAAWYNDRPLWLCFAGAFTMCACVSFIGLVHAWLQGKREAVGQFISNHFGE